MKENEQMDLSPAEEYFRAALQFAQFQLIQKELPPPEVCEGNELLDQRILRRMDALIRDGKRKAALKTGALTILKTLFVVLLISDLCVTAAFALSGAFREQVMKLFVTTHPAYSDVSFSDEGADLPQTALTSFSEYTVSWFPDDSFSVTEKTDTPLSKSVAYTSPKGVSVFLDVSSVDVSASINTEGMIQKNVRAAGIDLRVFHADGKSFVIWQEDNLCFILSSMGLSEAEAILAAVSVTAVDDPGTGAYGIP